MGKGVCEGEGEGGLCEGDRKGYEGGEESGCVQVRVGEWGRVCVRERGGLCEGDGRGCEGEIVRGEGKEGGTRERGGVCEGQEEYVGKCRDVFEIVEIISAFPRQVESRAS